MSDRGLVMCLLAAGIPPTLLFDLAWVDGPDSSGILRQEGSVGDGRSAATGITSAPVAAYPVGAP